VKLRRKDKNPAEEKELIEIREKPEEGIASP